LCDYQYDKKFIQRIIKKNKKEIIFVPAINSHKGKQYSQQMIMFAAILTFYILIL